MGEWEVLLKLCFFIFFIGVLPGCGARESYSPASVMTSENPGEFKSESNLMESGSPADDEENKALETEVNAFGMPLMDDAVLLVTKTIYLNNYTLTGRVEEEYEYDREGRVLRHINDTPGSIYGDRWEYEYDAAGSMTKETCYELRDGEIKYWIEYKDANAESEDEGLRIGSRYEGEGNLVSEIVCNREGDLIKIIHYREDGTVSRVYEYDGAGNRLRDIDYDEHGNISNRREFEYDAAGNMTLMADYDADGNIKVNESYDCDTYQIIHHYWPTENQYNDVGNLIKKVNYDYNGNILNVIEYTYDDAGSLLRCVDDDLEHSAIDVTDYEYDSDGNMTKEIDIPDVEWKEYEYDSENRIIKLTEYIHGKAYIGYEYEYRSIGVESYY